jgi:hypothetical protein
VDKKTRLLIVVVSVAAVVALVVGGWFFLVFSAPKPQLVCYGPGSLGYPTNSISGGEQRFNFTVVAPFGHWWNMVTIEVLDVNEHAVPTSASGWGLTVVNTLGGLVASYAIQAPSPTWTVGGGAMVWSGQSVLLTAPQSISLAGDGLRVLNSGGCQGTIWMPGAL